MADEAAPATTVASTVAATSAVAETATAAVELEVNVRFLHRDNMKQFSCQEPPGNVRDVT